jgi:hypothetical protein
LLGSGHVVTLGRVARSHAHDRVGALPGRDADVRQAQLQLDRDWVWRFEVRHVLLPAGPEDLDRHPVGCGPGVDQIGRYVGPVFANKLVPWPMITGLRLVSLRPENPVVEPRH